MNRNSCHQLSAVRTCRERFFFFFQHLNGAGEETVTQWSGAAPLSPVRHWQAQNLDLSNLTPDLIPLSTMYSDGSPLWPSALV